MELEQALDIRRGITAVIGGGGKTTLLRVLGERLAHQGYRVVLCTTTKFFPFPGLENLVSPAQDGLCRTLECCRLVAAGAPVPGTGKLTAPELPMERLAALADYVLVEADGSAGRPMKAHAPHEPVIPPGADQTVLVLGASGFGQPIAQAAHRPRLYAELAGAAQEDPVTPELAAAVLRAEGLPQRVFVNQAETPSELAHAQRLGELLPCPVWAGALQKGGWISCSS
ncbi:MAG: putative selenium-dependent hydroxylase accessory protein YqeC [Oscillospiraceae bacterium]|nr:putative selenium-dependent hydroxylase accessory protein YqeC [Oscillospiraceae bacterium]